MTIDLTAPGSVESLKDKPFAIKEGAKFRMKANFVVQHDVLNGLKYIEVIKRKGIKVGKREEMLVRILKPCPLARTKGDQATQGSYAPNTEDRPLYERKCESANPVLPSRITQDC